MVKQLQVDRRGDCRSVSGEMRTIVMGGNTSDDPWFVFVIHSLLPRPLCNWVNIPELPYYCPGTQHYRFSHIPLHGNKGAGIVARPRAILNLSKMDIRAWGISSLSQNDSLWTLHGKQARQTYSVLAEAPPPKKKKKRERERRGS